MGASVKICSGYLERTGKTRGTVREDFATPIVTHTGRLAGATLLAQRQPPVGWFAPLARPRIGISMRGPRPPRNAARGFSILL